MTPSAMTLRHLQRDAATALELALVALAPSSIIEGLATAAGLIQALTDLPLDSDPLAVWAANAVDRAERALVAWREWEAQRKVTA